MRHELHAEDGIQPARLGRTWVLRPRRDGWPFRKSFPTKWRAELALDVWRRGGRVSDYWAAARREAERRAASGANRANRRTAVANPRRRTSTPTQGETEPHHAPRPRTLVLIRRGVVVLWRMGLLVVAAGLVVKGILDSRSIGGSAVLAIVGAVFASGMAGALSPGRHQNFQGRWYHRRSGIQLSNWGAIMVALIGALIGLLGAPR